MPPARQRSIVVDFYGAFARRLGGWVAVSHLITLLGDAGADAGAVRSSLSRLKRRGWLVPERRGTTAGYALSPQAVRDLAHGDERIYRTREPARLSDGWVLVSFSVPEQDRDKRHLLRSRLTRLGFGSGGPGLWIAPRRLLPATRELLEDLGLARYVCLFSAGYEGFGHVRTMVERAWDLPGLAAMYEDFLRTRRPDLARWRDPAGGTDREAFACYLSALSQWRRLPFLDPGLPSELLPAGWSGRRAAELFLELTSRLEGPALRHIAAVTGLSATEEGAPARTA